MTDFSLEDTSLASSEETEDVLVIMLYSRQAAPCTDLQQILAPVPGIRSLSIDTVDVRDVVLNSSQISVTSVPCLLVIDRTEGSVNSYQGEEAFELARYLRSNVEPEKLPETIFSPIQDQTHFTCPTPAITASGIPQVVAEKQQSLLERVEAMKAERANIPE